MGVQRLKDKHTWKSKPGYSICVIDRGLVRFDYPSHWILEPDEGAVHLHDHPPPVESCALGVSVFDVPGGDIHDLSLDETLLDSLGTGRKPYQQSEILHISRPDIEISWLEQRYRDAEHKREVRFRVALARRAALCLISMNYWAERAADLEPVWDEVLRTLIMGHEIADPAAGSVVQ